MFRVAELARDVRSNRGPTEKGEGEEGKIRQEKFIILQADLCQSLVFP